VLAQEYIYTATWWFYRWSKLVKGFKQAEA